MDAGGSTESYRIPESKYWLESYWAKGLSLGFLELRTQSWQERRRRSKQFYSSSMAKKARKEVSPARRSEGIARLETIAARRKVILSRRATAISRRKTAFARREMVSLLRAKGISRRETPVARGERPNARREMPISPREKAIFRAKIASFSRSGCGFLRT